MPILLRLLLASASLLGEEGPGDLLQDPPQEYEVKAEFLYNFASFARWPKESFAEGDSPVVVGVFGRDPFGKKLEAAFEDRTVNDRPVVVRRASRMKDLGKVHLLFVPGAEAGRLPDILKSLKGSNTLVVGESPGFASDGGSINFIRKGRGIAFEINPDALKRQGVSMHPTVLGLARIVRDGD